MKAKIYRPEAQTLLSRKDLFDPFVLGLLHHFSLELCWQDIVIPDHRIPGEGGGDETLLCVCCISIQYHQPGGLQNNNTDT